MDSDKISTFEISLLILNDDCLRKIFEFLSLLDFVHLAKTCDRLRNVADSVHKFKKIEVLNVIGNNSIDNALCSHEKFADILSVCGRHILSVSIWDGNDFILDTIRDNCEKLNSMELTYFSGPLALQDFKNLKELKVSCIRVQKCTDTALIDELLRYFESNPNIESFEDHTGYKSDGDVMKLLQMLPKLKSLHLSLHINQCLQSILNLNHLTKLSFRSFHICNKLLMELSTKTTLVELEISMVIDEDTFAIIQFFRNLEVLSILTMMQLNWPHIPENTVFPPKLKQIKLFKIFISYSTFVSTVKQLKFLEEFDLGDADIVQDLEC